MQITIPVLIQLISAIVAAAPSAIEAVNRGRAFVQALFTASLISADTQNAGMAFVDAISDLWATGTGPAHWQVEPDPS